MNLATSYLGMTLNLLIHRGTAGYVFVAVALAVPWEMLAAVIGDVDEYLGGAGKNKTKLN